MTAAPLAGYRVLELAHLVAGPLCGTYLADMGADVIKVEAPAGECGPGKSALRSAPHRVSRQLFSQHLTEGIGGIAVR